MKITKTELVEIVRGVIREQLETYEHDEHDVGVMEASKTAYRRMLELKKKYRYDFWLLGKIGPEAYEEILSAREGSKKYHDFYKKVGPGEFDRQSGRYVRNNAFGMTAEKVSDFWHKKLGSVKIKELQLLSDEYDNLKYRFSYVAATSEVDSMYGRKRINIVDSETDIVVGSATDREGSLGS